MFAPSAPWNTPAGLNRGNDNVYKQATDFSGNYNMIPDYGKVYRCSRFGGGSLKACKADGSIIAGECIDKTCKYYISGDLERKVIDMGDGKKVVRKNVEGRGMVYEEETSLEVVEQFSGTKKRKFGDFE